MKIGELAQKIHVHRVHAWRLAKAGIIPGTKRTKGGHYYFVEGPSLTKWINFMIGGAFRNREMSRAYEGGYGGIVITPEGIKEERKLRRAWKEVKKLRKDLKSHVLGYDELFDDFFTSTENLIKVLEEITVWRECKLKADLLKASHERLTVLRDLLTAWLSGDQS